MSVRLPEFAVVVCALLVACASPASGQSGWPTTDWAVTCTAPTATDLGTFSCDANEALGPAGIARGVLARTSAWLAGEDFRAPNIERVGRTRGAYQAWFSAEENVATWGVYTPARRRLTLHPSFGYAPQGATPGGQLLMRGESVGIAAHELFHGVQNAYHSGAVYDSFDRDWIWEGTADYIESIVLERETGEQRTSTVRSYSHPLHIPADQTDAYRTVHFWRWLSETIGGPQHVGVVRRMLEEDLGDGLGLTGLHTALQADHPKGLAHYFPGFIAEKATVPGYFSRDARHEHRLPARRAARAERLPATVEPVAGTWHWVLVDAPANETVGVSIRFEDDHPDLYLSVDDLRYDGDGLREGLRNVFRSAWSGTGQTDTLFVRVANVAEDPASSTARPYVLEVEVAMLDACADAAMQATLPRRAIGLRPSGFDEDRTLRPGAARLAFSGLVSDRGDACTFNLGEVSIVGQALRGDEPDAALEAEMAARIESAQQRIEQIDLEALAARVDAGTFDPDEAGELMDLGEEMQGLLGATDRDDASAVVHVFSPHLALWQVGILEGPFAAEHGGVGGWSRNAAGHVVIELPGTPPEDLRRGETYRAVAVAHGSDDGPADGAGAETTRAFYTAWQGTHAEVPYGPFLEPADAVAHAAAVQRCRAARAQLDAGFAEMRAGGLLTPAAGDLFDCDVRGLAFQGTTQELTGRLEGTLTVTSVTGGSVAGTFELSGQGTLRTETSRFTYARGRLLGDTCYLNESTCETDERDGPISVSGTFEAPALLEGIPRGPRFEVRSVRLETAPRRR